MNNPLTNTDKSKLFRKRNAELGRSELRGVWATDDEKATLKKTINAELDKIRKEDDQ